MLMGEPCERSNFFRLIDRPHLGGLCNRNDSRLRVVFVANAVVGVADGFQGDLSVLLRQRNQLAAGMFFRRAAFVGINVRIVAAQDRLKGPGEGLQAQDIRAGSVEGEKNCNIRPKCSSNLWIADRV